MAGLANFYHIDKYGVGLGGLGVTLFFVLSGFLITYILLEEREGKGISIKQFYLRRIFRIWPLYYLTVILFFFVVTQFEFFRWDDYYYSGYSEKLTLYLLFLPNLAFVLYPAMPFASPAWSIGVEEQFYLFWPIVIKFIKPVSRSLISVIIFIALLNAGLEMLLMSGVGASNSILAKLYQFMLLIRFDCMAYGAIAAWLWKFKPGHTVVKIIFRKDVQYLTVILLVMMAVFKFSPIFIHHLPYSVLFAILILNLACNPERIFSLENRFFNYLGKISYGLYMYHVFAIFIIYKLVTIYQIKGEFLLNLYLYLFSMILAIIISSISYYAVERPFLKIKIKHSQMLSGDFAK